MPISVKCPECEAPYKVPDEAAGKAIKCKKCGARISIPAADAGDEGGDDFASIGAGGDSGGGGEAKEKKKGGSNKTIIIIVAAVLVLTCCICIPGGGAGVYFLWIKPGVDAGLKKFNEDMKKIDKNFDNKNFGKDMGKDGGPKASTGKIILEQKSVLSAKDPQVEGKPAKSFPVNFAAGKTYIIDMKSTEMDSFLRLLDPAKKEVAKDDDGGGFPDARITYTATQAGSYTIQATTFIGIAGQPNFTLTVREQ
jgi:predicted Zn finger-like uncharacterized protein